MSSAMGMTPEELAHTITEAQHINAAKYYLIASITMMAYDMVLTFHLETTSSPQRHILTHPGLLRREPHFSANLDFTDISNSHSVQLSATCATYAITNLMMTLRVHALWQNKWVLGYLLSLCVIQVAMWGYVLNYSEPVSYPNIDVIFHGCILTGKPSFGNQWQMWLFAYVVFDSSVFALVLAKTLRYSRETHSPLVKTLRNDGTAYFIVIFTVNVVWLVMTFHATETLKNINEHFSHLVSVVLISRLTIHLRSEGDRHSKEIWRPGPPVPSARGRHHSNSFSSPPDQTGSVSTYAGQRWSRSEKGKNKSIDGVGSPPESVSTHIGPSPGSTVADLNKDLEKMGESSRIWRRGSLLRRDSVAFEGERQRERPPSWMNRMRTVSRRESGALPPSSTEMEPYVRSFPQTMASWDSTREAGPSPIEAAALSIRRSEDDVFAFSMPERPPVARLATEYI
ncbi:hypothetical protein RHS04_00108 [Rhizoctonia solani]|uniref:Uncharacterized protein n=2 Tax=Rhizoctonia solani TaxID=456999 RepID=A0A8H7HFD7_9AGAM|nr:hypothetical protein RHS04_00108 [Rhizoctonia solani]